MQISFKSVRIFVTIRENREKMAGAIGKLPKIGIRTPLKLYAYFGFVSETTGIYPTTFPNGTQSMEMVKNCVHNRSRPDEIDTETEICTSLKS